MPAELGVYQAHRLEASTHYVTHKHIDEEYVSLIA